MFKTEATNFAATRPCKVVVFFRHGYGTATGGAFSSANINYLAMPGFYRTNTRAYYRDTSNPKHDTPVQNIKLLAHELGHYLGIPHPFSGVSYSGYSNPEAAVLDYMTANGISTLDGLDADRAYVRDTPPDVGAGFFSLMGWNRADLTKEVVISSPGQGINISFSPDRHNVMNYFGICDDYIRISQDQVRRIREWLREPHRLALRDPCADDVYARWESYDQGCPGTGGQVPLHKVDGSPVPGSSFEFLVENALANTAGGVLIGRLKLQTALDPIGMPGCDLLVSPIWNRGLTTNGAGAGSHLVSLPTDNSLIGARFFSQVYLLDMGAPTVLPVIASNGIELLIGSTL